MRKWLKEYAAPLYLGVTLSMLTGCSFTTWQYYAIAVPVVILYEIRRA